MFARILHGLLLTGCAFLYIGCCSQPEGEYEDFIPVQIGTGTQVFTFHPEYWEDPDFTEGLPLLLDDYGHEYKKIHDRVMVREHMARENRPHDDSGWSDELEYRCNLTTKAFRYGREHREKQQE